MVEANPQPPEHDGDEQPPGGLLHPAIRYEHADANFRWILGLLGGALILGVVVHFVILRYYFNHAHYEEKIKASQYPLAAENGHLPAEPRLEQLNRLANIEKGDIRLRLVAKEQVLHSYGPLPEEQGYVHIPI